MPEGEDLQDIEESEALAPGQNRFGNLLKSMMARLEMYNSLAPIQEYGRHQLKSGPKKKKQ